MGEGRWKCPTPGTGIMEYRRPAATHPAPDIDIGAKVGLCVREVRLELGLTQAELSRRTGIHRPNIARLENARHAPSLETVYRVAYALGVQVTSLLADLDTPVRTTAGNYDLREQCVRVLNLWHADDPDNEMADAMERLSEALG